MTLAEFKCDSSVQTNVIKDYNHVYPQSPSLSTESANSRPPKVPASCTPRHDNIISKIIYASVDCSILEKSLNKFPYNNVDIDIFLF